MWAYPGLPILDFPPPQDECQYACQMGCLSHGAIGNNTLEGNMSSYAMCKCMNCKHELFMDVHSIPLDERSGNILSFDTLENNVDNKMYIIYGEIHTHFMEV